MAFRDYRRLPIRGHVTVALAACAATAVSAVVGAVVRPHLSHPAAYTFTDPSGRKAILYLQSAALSSRVTILRTGQPTVTPLPQAALLEQWELETGTPSLREFNVNRRAQDYRQRFQRITSVIPGWRPPGPPSSLPRWLQWVVEPRLPPDVPEESVDAIIMDSAGWPFPVLTCSTALSALSVAAPHFSETLRGGVVAASGKGAWAAINATPARLDDYRPVPVAINWLGASGSLVAWWLMLWAGTAILRILRGTYRRRHGLCPSCGYPGGVQPTCAECGAATGVPTPAPTTAG